MASDYSAARQEFVDRINAGASLGIPFIQKRVNYGKRALNEDARSNGVINLFVPAGGTGEVVDISSAAGVNDSALDITAQLAAGKGSASFYEVKCYARNAMEYFQHGVLEKMFQIGNLDKNIIQGRINHMCQNVEKDIVTRNWTKAGGACVAGSSEIGFVAMDKAMAMLQTIKSEGAWTGYMSPLFKSKLSSSAAAKSSGFDVPDDILRQMYGRHAIGIYAGCDWVNEAFMPEYTTGTFNPTDTASAAVKTAVTQTTASSTTGYSVISLKNCGASGTVPKGTPFTIAGVYDVSTGGLAMPFLKVFVTQEDAVADGSGNVDVKVLPIYFNDDTKGYTNNIYVSGSEIPVNAAVTPLVDKNTSYYVAMIKEDSAFNWTPFELDDVEGCKNTTTSTDDLTVQLVSGGDLKTRKNAMRFDCPYFGDIVDPRACRLVFYKK